MRRTESSISGEMSSLRRAISAMTAEPDQKSMEMKQNADITAKDDEEVPENRRSEKDEERQEPQEEKEIRRSERTRKTPVRYG